MLVWKDPRRNSMHGYCSSVLLQILGIDLEIKNTIKGFCIPSVELQKANTVSLRGKQKF